MSIINTFDINNIDILVAGDVTAGLQELHSYVQLCTLTDMIESIQFVLSMNYYKGGITYTYSNESQKMYEKIDNILIFRVCVSNHSCIEVDIIDNIDNFSDHIAIKYHITIDTEGIAIKNIMSRDDYAKNC